MLKDSDSTETISIQVSILGTLQTQTIRQWLLTQAYVPQMRQSQKCLNLGWKGLFCNNFKELK